MSKEREEIQTAPVGDVDWGAISEEFFRKIEERKERLGIKLLPISDIEGGKSIAKVVPNNLGKLLFFSTSNPNDAKHTPKYYALRRAFIIVPTLAFMALALQHGRNASPCHFLRLSQNFHMHSSKLPSCL